MRLASVLAALLFVTACDSSGGGPSGDGGGGAGDAALDGAGTSDAGTGVVRLVESAYSLEPSSEIYQCERVTLTQDVYVTSFTPLSPAGTHHILLAIDPSEEPDGKTICGRSIAQDWIVLFASGVNSPTLTMPPGVAFKIGAGEQVVLNLHLFNASDQPIANIAGIEVGTTRMADVSALAEVVIAGKIMFEVQPGDDQKISATCSQRGDTNLFAVFPHMHQLGKRAKVWTEGSGGTQVVWDDVFDFEDQRFVSFAPIPLKQGDKIGIECTYNNTTGSPVRSGESSNEEMCFAISYRYPPVGPQPFLGPLCEDLAL